MLRLGSLFVVVACCAGCYRSHPGNGSDARETGVADGSTPDARVDGTAPLDTGGGFFDTGGGFFDTGGGFADTGGGFIDTGGFVDTGGGFVDTGGGFVDTGGGFVDTGGGFDTGMPDAWLPDTGPVDAFVPDAWAADSGPPPTSSAIRCRPSTVLLIPDHPRLDFGPTATLELYVRARAPGTVAVKGILEGLHNFTLRIEGSGDAAELVGGWGNGSAETLVRVPFGSHMGVWTHVALVQQDLGTTVAMTVYLDGVLALTSTVPDDFAASTSSLDFRLCMLDGDMDEVRLWRVAREQMSIIADLRRSLPPGIVQLSAYWPLEGTSQVVLDRSLHGADGVLGTTSDVEAIDPMPIPDGAF